MKEMTSRERFQRMFQHKEADRVPIIDGPWGSTIERWQREEMPKETNYGRKLVLHGGINAVLWDHPDLIKAEMERVVPVLKENGGYMFSSDHSIPSSVGLEDFRQIVALAKKLGSY